MGNVVLGNAVAIHTLLGDGSHGRRLHVCGEGSLLYQPLRTQNDGPKLQDFELLAFLVRDRGLHIQEHNLHSSHDSLCEEEEALSDATVARLGFLSEEAALDSHNQRSSSSL
jgi:hypothetical protein